MAKKKKAPKKAVKKSVKKAVKKTAKSVKKKSPARKSAAKKKAASTKASGSKPAARSGKKTTTKVTRKKGVRRATMTTGIRSRKAEKKIGRSRIPLDAPLSIVFERLPDAQQAFELLEITTIRELEEFTPDELVIRLTSPAKQTVGRIRKYLAMNNRFLSEDESFAIEYQESRKQDQ